MSGFDPVIAMQSSGAPPGGAAPSQLPRSGNGFWRRALRHRSFMAGGGLSLLLVGARSSIAVGVIAVSIGISFGVSLGLVAAARKGWVEEVIMRLGDFT